MADFSKILNHPEKQIIISKLCSGDTPKAIATYLRNKFDKPDENHLRLPVTLLEEFLQTYGVKFGFIKQAVKDENSSKFDKEIAQSLLANKEWRELIEEVTNDEIDLRLKLNQILKVLETRTEQIFDKIQENPGGFKGDYVFDKLMNSLLLVIDRIDKIQNDRPDMRIEHTYTVQMVEQHTVAFQEAIRKVLQRMSPEFTVLFMEYLNEEMAALKPGENPIANTIKSPNDIQRELKAADKLMVKAESLDADFEDLEKSEVQHD